MSQSRQNTQGNSAEKEKIVGHYIIGLLEFQIDLFDFYQRFVLEESLSLNAILEWIMFSQTNHSFLNIQKDKIQVKELLAKQNQELTLKHVKRIDKLIQDYFMEFLKKKSTLNPLLLKKGCNKNS